MTAKKKATKKPKTEIPSITVIDHSHYTEEIYPDGSRRYLGKVEKKREEGAILWHRGDGKWEVVMPKGWLAGGSKRGDLLMLLRLWDQAPQIEGTIGESQVLEKLPCAEILLRAMQKRDAAFFRELGDHFKPRKATAEKADESKKWKNEKDDDVINSILDAAKSFKRLPRFEEVLVRYRNTKDHASETPSGFKEKLKPRGFEWLGMCL
jgi:hypothetical protein